VQNWNEGKSQEYKDRLTYNLSDFNAGRCCTGGGVVISPEVVNSTIVEPDAVTSSESAAAAADAAIAEVAETAAVIEEAALTEAAAAAADTIVDDAKKIAEESAPKAEAVDDKGQLLLFTTQKCPNCKLAKEFLSGVDYTVIDAEENSDLAMKYGIMQAPTLVVLGDKVEKYANASNIRRYVNERSGQ
jgi:glutaredoxin